MSDFTGRCLCGAVTFTGRWGGDPLRACHCSQCRRWSGHVWAAAQTAEGERSFDAEMVLVATGASPRELPEAKPDGERILTWTQVYRLAELPDIDRAEVDPVTRWVSVWGSNPDIDTIRSAVTSVGHPPDL